jgi:hypothetical protein
MIEILSNGINTDIIQKRPGRLQGGSGESGGSGSFEIL